MEKKEFFELISNQAKQTDILLSSEEKEKFYLYMNLLIEWNKKINLTAITEEKEIVQKHFIDSLTINKYIEKNMDVIDVGTGAGFPGIPIKIIRDDINVILLDALNKRINFLNNIIEKMNLNRIETIHYRAEEIGKIKDYRENFNIATSRAVAPLNVLLEYMLPLIKIGGKCICMKSGKIKNEINMSINAIDRLGGKIEKIDEFNLPDSDISRSIVVIKKIKNTPMNYPRKPGIPSKKPIK